MRTHTVRPVVGRHYDDILIDGKRRAIVHIEARITEFVGALKKSERKEIHQLQLQY